MDFLPNHSIHYLFEMKMPKHNIHDKAQQITSLPRDTVKKVALFLGYHGTIEEASKKFNLPKETIQKLANHYHV